MFKLENYEYIKYNLGALYVEDLIKQFEKSIKDSKVLSDCTYKSRNIEYIVIQ